MHRPDPLRYARLGRCAALFAHSASPPCAGAPAPARGRSGAACPPPLRGPGPALCALPPLRSGRLGRPSGQPPGSAARPLCAAVRLRGRSLAPLRLGSPSLRCGLPPLRSGRPCFAPGSPLRFAWPRRVPPGPPAWASGLRPPPPSVRSRRASAARLRYPSPAAPRGFGDGGSGPGAFAARPRLRGLAGCVLGPRCALLRS